MCQGWSLPAPLCQNAEQNKYNCVCLREGAAAIISPPPHFLRTVLKERRRPPDDQERCSAATSPATTDPGISGDPVYFCRGQARDRGPVARCPRQSNDLAEATGTRAPSL